MELRVAEMQNSLAEVLRNQIQALSSLRACQERMFTSVRERDWSVFLRESARMEECAGIFGTLEKRFGELLAAFSGGKPAAGDFYRITAQFLAEQRRQLNGMHRERKRLLVLSKAENAVFGEYVNGAAKMLSSLLNSVVPSKRNRMYTKSGSLSAGANEGFVLDRAF